MPLTRRSLIATTLFSGLGAALHGTAVRAAESGRPLRIDALGGPGRYTRTPGSTLDAEELADLRRSGLCALNVTVSSVGRYAQAFEETLSNLAYWNAQVDASPDHLMRIARGADLERARASGRAGLVFGFQDTTPLSEDPDRIELFHRLGVRVIQLTYNNRNLVGDGCLEPADAGLSKFGRATVERLNAQRVLIDLSHGGRRTTLEAVAASKAPIAITHTGCAAINPVPRNKTDEELRAVAARGGVIGIYLMPFLRASGQPTATDLVAHIEHAIEVAGEEHVGIGTDGDVSAVPFTEEFKQRHRDDVAERRRRGISAPGEDPEVYTFLPDLNVPDRFERIGEALRKRGHSATRIDKVLGLNVARVMREVWG